MRQPARPIARVALAVVAVALLVPALTACGIGKASNEEKISKTATTYLRALADGDAAKACSELTRRARRGGCPRVMRERASQLDADTLRRAADDSMDIDVHGDSATAGLSEPDGARFVLARSGGEWRIDSGYTLGSASS